MVLPSEQTAPIPSGEPVREGVRASGGTGPHPCPQPTAGLLGLVRQRRPGDGEVVGGGTGPSGPKHRGGRLTRSLRAVVDERPAAGEGHRSGPRRCRALPPDVRPPGRRRPARQTADEPERLRTSGYNPVRFPTWRVPSSPRWTEPSTSPIHPGQKHSPSSCDQPSAGRLVTARGECRSAGPRCPAPRRGRGCARCLPPSLPLQLGPGVTTRATPRARWAWHMWTFRATTGRGGVVGPGRGTRAARRCVRPS